MAKTVKAKKMASEKVIKVTQQTGEKEAQDKATEQAAKEAIEKAKKEAQDKATEQAAKEAIEKAKKEVKDKVTTEQAAKEAIEKDKFTTYAQGYERGFKAGVESKPDTKNIQRIAFDDGVRYIVTLADNFLVKELELPDREALAKSGKIPAWWIAVLVTNFELTPGSG